MTEMLLVGTAIEMFKNENSFEEWKQLPRRAGVKRPEGLKMRIPLRSGNYLLSNFRISEGKFKNENSFEEWKLRISEGNTYPSNQV